MKLIIYIAAIVLLTVSCSSKKENAELIIPADSMAIILADVHLADATLSSLINKNRFNKIDEYYFTVLQKHNVTRTRLDSSISYYSSKGKEFEAIYEEVMFILSEKEGATVAEKEDAPQIDKVRKYEQVYSYISNFDDNKPNKLLSSRSAIRAKSGEFSVLVNHKTRNTNEFVYSIKFAIKDIKLVFNTDVSLIANKTKTFPSIVIEVYNGNKIEQQTAISFKDYIVAKQEWSSINIKNNISLPASIDEGKIKVYISNPYKNDFFIDNFNLQIYVR